MLVLMLCDNDPAGMAIAQAKAVMTHTPHTVRVASTKTVYRHGWEADLHVPALDAAGLETLRDLMAQADIFHFHMVIDEHHSFGPLLPRDFLRGKAIVHHHHGHHDFRANPQAFQEKYARLGRRNLLVSTPDLLHKLPGALWQPNHVPVHSPPYMPLLKKPAAPLVLAHSPTRKDLKNTDALKATVAALQAEGVSFVLDCIDDVPHTECLARKRRAHIAFDHLQGYYGVSSLESLSMGLPTIAGLDGLSRRCLLEYSGAASLPWVVSSLETLAQDLRSLLEDEPSRAAIGEASRQFMVSHFDDAKAARNLVAFWEACLARQ